MTVRFAKGYSLIEVAIALVTLGVLSLLVMSMVLRSSQQLVSRQLDTQFDVVDRAIRGFIPTHNRPPCADQNGDGREDCGSATAAGTLPYVTLGIASASVRDLRYSVLRDLSADPTQDQDLASEKDRFAPLVTHNVARPDTREQLLGASTFEDFCSGLAVAARNGQIAYRLERPTDTQLQGEERPHVVSAMQLFGHLSCAQALAASGTAHFNVGTAALFLARATQDNVQIRGFFSDMDNIGVENATFAQLTALSGAATALADQSIAAAEALISNGTAVGLIPIAAATLGQQGLSAAAAAKDLGLAACGRSSGNGLRSYAQRLAAVTARHAQNIQQAARDANRAQWWTSPDQLQPIDTSGIAISQVPRGHCG